MATPAVDRVFVDTNVLVYSTLRQTPQHAAARAALAAHRQAGTELWISRQVLREYLAVVTRPGGANLPIPMSAAISDVLFFQQAFHVADERADVTADLLKLLQQVLVAGKQVHDANIVATMQAYGIGKLLTHNVSDFVRFGSLIAIVPLIP